MADRIKNYAQEASQINTLKSIRSTLDVTPSTYTPDTSVVTKDRVATFAQAEEELTVLGDIDLGMKRLKGDVDVNAGDIANIKALLKGQLYDYQTDTDEKYVKTVPAGAMPYAGLEQIGGKTVVMNQIGFVPTNTRTENDVTIVSNGTNVDITGTASAATPLWYFRRDDLIVGHNVLFRFPSNLSNTDYYFRHTGTSEVHTDSFILNVTSYYATIGYFTLYVASGVATNITYIPQVFDLTLMFGAGNEPSTVAEFESMFPASYYPYNAGELLSAGVTEVESVGINIWDEEWEIGAYNPSNGEKTTVNNQIRCANRIKIFPSTLYYFLITYTSTIGGFGGAYFYDINGNHLPNNNIGIQTNGQTFTTPSNAYYMTFAVSTLYGTTYKNDICLNVSNASINGTYYPYMSNTYPIPAEVRALAGYGFSVINKSGETGIPYNYIDYERKVYVQNVAAFTLNPTIVYDLVPAYSDEANGKYCYTTSSKPQNTVFGALSNRFTFAHHGFSRVAPVGSFTYSQYGTYFMTPYATHEAFEATITSENPIIIYYKLETPVEVDISEYITDDNLIQVEANGTLTFKNSNGDDYRIPVPSTEEYMINLQEA